MKEFTVGEEGHAAIPLPEGTWEFTPVSNDPEVTAQSVRRTVNADNPKPEPVILVLEAAKYWCDVTVQDAEDNPVPGATVTAERVEDA